MTAYNKFLLIVGGAGVWMGLSNILVRVADHEPIAARNWVFAASSMTVVLLAWNSEKKP